MNSRHFAPTRMIIGCVKAFLLFGVFALSVGSLHAQSPASEAESVDLLPEAVEVAQDLNISNPAIHNTYTADDIQAIAGANQIEDLKEIAFDNGATDMDVVKFYYYSMLNQQVLDWGLYPEDALLLDLNLANEAADSPLNNAQLRQLYLDTLVELD